MKAENTMHKITVTQKHIDNGFRCNAGKCPIALAANEQLPKLEGCYYTVGHFGIHVESIDCSAMEHSGYYPLPEAAQQFIVRFDAPYELTEDPVRPFEFKVEFKTDSEIPTIDSDPEF